LEKKKELITRSFDDVEDSSGYIDRERVVNGLKDFEKGFAVE